KGSGTRKDSSDSTDSGPRKDGTDSKDNTSTSRRDDNQDDRGGTDGPDGGRPPSPKTLEEFKSHTWGNKDNPANQQAFRDDLRRLLNDNKPGQKYNEFFKEFYKENSGHRKKADTTIGPDEWGLPRILRDENGDWVPLKPAEQPTYLGEKTSRRLDDPNFLPEKKGDLKKEELREIERREKLKKDLRELDKTAKERRTRINASMAAWDHLKKMEMLHGEYKDKGPNHPQLEKAKKDYQKIHHESTKTNETFGENTARIGDKFEFDGDAIIDKNGETVMRHKVDKDGNTIYENGEPKLVELAPDLTDATEIKPSPFAPKNGNDQFDLIHRAKDG